jgi:hypothetical protein
MRRFLYWCDPLFGLACAAYGMNRRVVKPHVHAGFFHSYFNDLWLIPCALPILLWLHRRLGLRTHDNVPELSDIFLHLVFWSLLFELIGPHFIAHTTSDPFDMLAYAAGAVVAGLWWHRERWRAFFRP